MTTVEGPVLTAALSIPIAAAAIYAAIRIETKL